MIDINEKIIPQGVLVGFGRSQTIQYICSYCKKQFFPKDPHDFLCSVCASMQRIDFKVKVAESFYIDIIKWEQRFQASKRRSTYNFRKAAKRDEYTCQYCGYSPRYVFSENRLLHIDHIIPFSHGGNNRLDNLITACSLCNHLLHNKVFKTFLDKKIYLFERLKERNQPLTRKQWLRHEAKLFSN